MIYERVVIEAGDNTFTLDLHPRMTVIAGMGQMERDGLVSEMVGALSNSRAGVHLELLTAEGRRLAVFRPTSGKHRVVDVDRAVDVTPHFSDRDGEIDLLARVGLDLRMARRKMRIGTADLATAAQQEKVIRELARANQNELWDAANHVREVEVRLDREAAASGSTAEDAGVIQRIEERHTEFEAAQSRLESFRRTSFFVGMFSVASALGAVALLNSMTLAAPFLIAAALTTAVSLMYWRKTEAARVAEEEALAAAGASSYLGFHLQRVNGLLDSDKARRHLMELAAEHQVALNRWKVVAGDRDVEWVLEHRHHIASASLLLNDETPDFGSSQFGPGSDTSIVFTQAISSRLAELRSIGESGECFPALLDEPFSTLDSAGKSALLETLVHASHQQQVVFLTDDPEVAAWARLEAMTGELSIVEPQPEHIESRGPHVAA